MALIHSAANSSWTRSYTYADPANNRLTGTIVGALTEQPYGYDPHGNLIQMPHLPVMEWDFKDQLHVTQQQVVNAGVGERTYYLYDAAGQRVRKITERANGTRKQERLYLGGFELYREYDGAGSTVTLERETLHVMDDKRLVALVETQTIGASFNSVTRYQFDNHLGSAALELDEQAAVISYEEYYPYGSTSYQAGRSAVEVSLKRYRYTGKERDAETGLYYHGARYYAPWLGRWTSCDPLSILFRGSNLTGSTSAQDRTQSVAPYKSSSKSSKQSPLPNNDHSRRERQAEMPPTSTCSYEYVNGRVITNIDDTGLDAVNAVELTKDRLDELAQEHQIGTKMKSEVNRQRAVGRWFQNKLLSALGLNENGRQLPTMTRDLSTVGQRKYVTPDAISTPSFVTPEGMAEQRYFRSESQDNFERGLERIAFHLGFSGKVLPDSTFYEFKALKAGTTINLSDSGYQIKGLIDAAAQTAATKDVKSPTPSAIHFVTTAGVKIGDDVVTYARMRDVLIVQHVAEEVRDHHNQTFGIRIGAGRFLNEELVTRRGAIVTSDPSRIVLLRRPVLLTINIGAF